MTITIIPNQVKAVSLNLSSIFAIIQQNQVNLTTMNPLLTEFIVETNYSSELQFEKNSFSVSNDESVMTMILDVARTATEFEICTLLSDELKGVALAC